MTDAGSRAVCITRRRLLTGAGTLADIVLGIVGAIVGGYIGNLIGMGPTVSILTVWNIILAVIGAIIVLWVYHAVVART